MPRTTALAERKRAAPPAQELDLKQLGQVMAASGFFQDARDAAQAIVKILAGRELGFGPVASMMGVYVVKGRISYSANFMLAAMLRSGRYKHQIVKHDGQGCSIKVFRRDGKGEPWEEVGVSTFTADDAKAAGLTSSDNYRKFPRNMYFARAASNAAKWFAADCFVSTPYTPDELSDIRMTADGEYEVEAVPAQVEPSSPGSRPGRLDRLKELLRETDTPSEKLMTHYKVASLDDLTDDNIRSALTLLEAKLKVK